MGWGSQKSRQSYEFEADLGWLLGQVAALDTSPGRYLHRQTRSDPKGMF